MPNATGFILDALNILGVTKIDSGTLSEFGLITRLDGLPPGILADKQDWSNDTVKLWLINTFSRTEP